jgi:hypothetical protein
MYNYAINPETAHKNYDKGINPTELFKINVMGFQTHRDDFAIDFEKFLFVYFFPYYLKYYSRSQL